MEDAIQEGLPSALELGAVEALGLWDGSALCGLATWSPGRDDPTVWTTVVAVQLGYHRHGYGRRLKEEPLPVARSAGARVVVSIVHRDKEAMLKINGRLGAAIEPDPDDPYRNYLLCTITLRGGTGAAAR